MQTFFENHQLIIPFVVGLAIIVIPYFCFLSAITIIFTITNIIDGIYWICGYNKVELPRGTFQRYPRYIYLTNSELEIYKKQRLEEEERKKRNPPPPYNKTNHINSDELIKKINTTLEDKNEIIKNLSKSIINIAKIYGIKDLNIKDLEKILENREIE